MGPTNATSPNSDPLYQDSRAPATSRLHKRVYTLLIAFSAWFALAVWIFAGDRRDGFFECRANRAPGAMAEMS
jgi:hypothetical protein